jgi:hypothetical protein
VNWYVFSAPVTVAADDIKTFGAPVETGKE